MKIIAPKENLANALLIAENIVASKVTKSILSNVLLETEDKKLKVISTNLDISIKIFVNAEIKREGGITLHAKTLTDAIKSLSQDDVLIEVNEATNQTIIKSMNEEDKIEYKMNGISKNDFPVFPALKSENVNQFTIPQKTLKDMIRKVIYAVSTEDAASSYRGISGVEMEIQNKYLKFAATDSIRLSTIRTPLDVDFELDNIIFPRKLLTELSKILSDEGEVNVGVTENFAYFKIGDIEIVSRLQEDKFPDYVNIIPKEYKMKVVFFTKKMASAIKRVSLISGTEKAYVHLSFDKNKVYIISSDPEIGEAKEEMDIAYDYDKFEIRFNSQFLLDAINSIDTEQFVMGFNSPHSAAMIKEEGSDDFLGLIMPIRLE
jgi:DNA polymerase-3 subunit beta